MKSVQRGNLPKVAFIVRFIAENDYITMVKISDHKFKAMNTTQGCCVTMEILFVSIL